MSPGIDVRYPTHASWSASSDGEFADIDQVHGDLHRNVVVTDLRDVPNVARAICHEHPLGRFGGLHHHDRCDDPALQTSDNIANIWIVPILGAHWMAPGPGLKTGWPNKVVTRVRTSATCRDPFMKTAIGWEPS